MATGEGGCMVGGEGGSSTVRPTALVCRVLPVPASCTMHSTVQYSSTVQQYSTVQRSAHLHHAGELPVVSVVGRVQDLEVVLPQRGVPLNPAHSRD